MIRKKMMGVKLRIYMTNNKEKVKIFSVLPFSRKMSIFGHVQMKFSFAELEISFEKNEIFKKKIKIFFSILNQNIILI